MQKIKEIRDNDININNKDFFGNRNNEIQNIEQNLQFERINDSQSNVIRIHTQTNINHIKEQDENFKLTDDEEMN